MDMKPGSQILCADGSIVMEVISADPKAGTVRAKCMNNATLGYAPMRASAADCSPCVVLLPSRGGSKAVGLCTDDHSTADTHMLSGDYIMPGSLEQFEDKLL